jgi:hypothetical protein
MSGRKIRTDDESVLGIWILDFGFVSDFVLRISDLFDESRSAEYLMNLLPILLVWPLLAGLAVGLAAEESQPVPLNPQKTVLLDRAGGKVLLKSEVCLREGLLEMLLCLKQTKEHESILTLDAKANVIHAGLLALGAESGTPAQFQPEYKPPTGQKIDVYVNWEDEQGKKHRVQAQEWIRHSTHRYFEAALSKVPDGVVIARDDESLRYDEMNSLLLWFGTMSEAQRTKFLAMSDDAAYRKAVQSLFEQSQRRGMKADFVFVGSAFRTLEDGTELYLAESGSVICVANFYDAMIDINIESSASNDDLLYEPATERIPPVGTPVTVELIPVREEKSEQ